jgi:TrmH family RNA methyltransferase
MITSSANPRIKDIRKLRERKHRSETNLAWVEGLRACGEAFSQPHQIHQVVICPELLHSDFAEGLIKKADENKLEVIPVNKEAFSSLSGKENPQGIGVVIHQRFHSIEEVFPKAGETWVVLDRIADPGNLGTIMRTLDACGGKGIILVDYCTDPYDPTALRASTGAVFHLDLVKVDSSGFAAWSKKNTAKRVGAVIVPGTVDYHAFSYADPILLLMGSEREGLQSSLMEVCDATVSIPMIGHVDSLNLAEATAIVLYEVFNQRRDQTLTRGGIL